MFYEFKLELCVDKMVSETSSGNSVEFSTFLGWKKEGAMGYKTEEINGKKIVNFVWCKECTRYKLMILLRIIRYCTNVYMLVY